MKECKYCKLPFEGLSSSQRANHSRWCRLNPKAQEYRDNIEHMRSFITEQSLQRASEKIKKLHRSGLYNAAKEKRRANPTFKGHHHTEEAKEKIREAALASGHRRLVKSTRMYICKDGSQVLLDSSWEEVLAHRLDDLGIAWTRPGYISYKMGDKYHKYFPDFYLTDFDMYLDPKNPQAMRVQQEKITILKSVLQNLVFLETLEECKQFDPGSPHQSSKLVLRSGVDG